MSLFDTAHDSEHHSQEPPYTIDYTQSEENLLRALVKQHQNKGRYRWRFIVAAFNKARTLQRTRDGLVNKWKRLDKNDETTSTYHYKDRGRRISNSAAVSLPSLRHSTPNLKPKERLTKHLLHGLIPVEDVSFAWAEGGSSS